MMQDEYQPTSQSDALPGDAPEWAEYRQGFPRLGEKLLDRYEIFLVREGGFGVVFGVTDLETNCEYAVKTYKPEFATTKSVELFKAEAAFWLNLEPHPNIVRAHFVKVIQDQPYLFMEYVTGKSATSLRDQLRHGRLAVDQAMRFAYQLCLGMEFTNRKREVVHGDLKPENLLIDMLDGQNVLKITDFGLAHRIEVRDGKYARAEAGTWAYAPPELFANQPMDSRWDVFAFGVIFYEMLTGKLPYPFELNRDPKVQFKQLADFYEHEGMMELISDIGYYDIVPSINGLGSFLGDCINNIGRRRDFRYVLRRMEQHFAQYLPVASNEPSAGFTRDAPVASTAPSATDLRQQARSLSNIGYYRQARSIWNRLLLQYPEDGQLWFEAGVTLLEAGDKSGAYQALKQATQLNPQLLEEQPWLEPWLKENAE